MDRNALWRRAALALILALPFLVSSALGFVWLYERGLLLWFAAASAVGFGAIRLVLWLRMRRAAAASTPERLDGPAPAADWSTAENAAFNRARARIRERTREPLDWQALPAEAFAVIEGVAADLSGGRRSALDFTLPEALLLIDRVALRYRAFLLANVPYSDRISVRALHWLWQRHDSALAAWETGFLAWRGVRLVVNPASALLREAERLLAQGVQSHLTDRLRRDAQAILLEEAAQAAIDLYSGRLKASDTEVAALAQAEETASAPVAGRLRLLVLGQPGSGKSALINHLSGAPIAAPGSVPSPGDPAAVETAIAGVPVRLTERSLGGDAARDAEAARDADLILWVHRAARPGRAADAAALSRLRSSEAPCPPIVHVVTGIDMLCQPWPPRGPEAPPGSAAIRGSVAEALDVEPPVAVSSKDTGWNLAALHAELAAALPDAQQARRRRLVTQAQGAARSRGVLAGNLSRARRGIGAALRRTLSRDET